LQAMITDPGHRVNCSRWGSTRQRMRHWACCLAVPGWMGPTLLGTTRLSFLRRLSSCYAESVSWVDHRGCWA
jgi:hypothetical protein